MRTSDPSALTAGMQRLAEQARLENGQGRTCKFRHEYGFPSIGTLEEVAEGLLGDVSGQNDILSRVNFVSFDSRQTLVFTHLEVILRARLFKLLGSVVVDFVDARSQLTRATPPLDTLLSLMAEKCEKILTSEEANSITRAVNSLYVNTTLTPLTKESVLDAAIQIIREATRNEQELGTRSSGNSKVVYQGLVPVLTEQHDVRLVFVPVRVIDYP